MIKMYNGLHVKYPLFLSDFKHTWTFSTDFRKILIYQISLKSVQNGAELFHADGQIDTRKIIVAFRDFANAPKNWNSIK
jgi:hypothetical protein